MNIFETFKMKWIEKETLISQYRKGKEINDIFVLLLIRMAERIRYLYDVRRLRKRMKEDIPAESGYEEKYYRLHMYCGNISLYEWINVDPFLRNTADYVLDPVNMRFPRERFRKIYIRKSLSEFRLNKVRKLIQRCYQILVPGGYLIFNFQRSHEDEITEILKDAGFGRYTDLYPKSETTITARTFKCPFFHTDTEYNDKAWQLRAKLRPETLTIEWRESHISTTVLRELASTLNKGQVISLGCGTGELEYILAKEGWNIIGLDVSKVALDQALSRINKEEFTGTLSYILMEPKELPFGDESITSIFAIEVLEHLIPNDLTVLFSEAYRVLTPGGHFFATVPNQLAYFNPGHVHFFDKEELARVYTEAGFDIEWIELERSMQGSFKHNMLKIMAAKRRIPKPNNTFNKGPMTVLLGAYETQRYSQLGFHWDGQARAFQKLGYNYKLVDSPETYAREQEIVADILRNKPEYVIVGLYNWLPFAQRIKETSGFKGKIIYWFCDAYTHGDIVKGLVDIMFLSNRGQIEDYKRRYGIKHVYFMPQAGVPEFLHYKKKTEKYDIAFTGTVTRAAVYSHREEIISALRNSFDIHVRNDIRNYISDFYASSKIVLGVNSSCLDELYTSNRFYLALMCGAFYLCEYFPGIELLVRNKEHVVWYENIDELINLAKYYLKKEDERTRIRINALHLARQKHTYELRIQNMFDIIEGRTESFYGFLD